jgi:RHS repeat-associated protein
LERGGQTYYYGRDALGSVTEMTNAAGALVERYEYDVYGQPAIFDGAGNPLTASAIGNPYLFTARQYDPESGNYDYRARLYSPWVGRFLQMDPSGYVDGMNAYEYVTSSPGNWIDPLGLVLKDPGGINCLGYASGAGGAVFPDPDQQESLKHVVKSLGFKCTGPTTGKCKCKCDEKRMIVYIYKYKDNPSKTDPWKDPWRKSPGNNDYHAIKASGGCRGIWSYIPRRFYDPGVEPQSTSNPNNPDSFWKGNVPSQRYCCCKANH